MARLDPKVGGKTFRAEGSNALGNESGLRAIFLLRKDVEEILKAGLGSVNGEYASLHNTDITRLAVMEGARPRMTNVRSENGTQKKLEIGICRPFDRLGGRPAVCRVRVAITFAMLLCIKSFAAGQERRRAAAKRPYPRYKLSVNDA